MKKHLYIGVILFFGMFYSCEEQNIDSIPLDFGDAHTIAADSTRVVQFLNNIYTYIPNGFGRIGNAFVACASDEAVFAVSGSSVSKWAMGGWNPIFIPDNPLDNSYSGIRATFVYENEIQPLISEGVMSSVGKEQIMGQIYFIRAYLNFQILCRFGGYPIADKVIEAAKVINIPRTNFDESVEYISSLCDLAIERLPLSVDNANLGRATQGAARALQSRLRLYAASKLFNDPENPDNNMQHGAYSAAKWELAAQKAAEIINLKDEKGAKKYTLANNRKKLFDAINDPEIIFNKLSAPSYQLEQLNAPPSLRDGKGGSCPTLDLVNAYGTNNGLAFDWNNPDMNSDPFKNRDPRFYEDILYNGASYIANHIVETSEGGSDTQGIYATKTGFYLRKFMNDEARWWGTTVTVNHSFIIFRYTEVLLNYAEAMNEAYGPDEDPKGYGLTARGAIKQIRVRAGLSGNTDLLQTVATGDKEGMRKAIRNERQVELAFEEHRGYDLRRWKLSEDVLNTPVSGLKITLNANGTYSYTPFKAESREFRSHMYYYPFPRTELSRNIGLVQNTGWE